MKQEKAHRSVIFIFQVLLILIIIAFVITSIYIGRHKLEKSFVEIVSYDNRGVSRAGVAQYPYYPGTLQIKKEKGEEGFWFLKVRNLPEGQKTYNGLVFEKEIFADQNAEIYLKLRVKGEEKRIALHIIDSPPPAYSERKGEGFLSLLDISPGEWIEITLKLSSIPVNSWQDKEAYTDGILNTNPLRSIHFGFEPGLDIELDIAEIRVQWDQKIWLFHLLMGFNILLALILFIRTAISFRDIYSVRNSFYHTVFDRIAFTAASIGLLSFYFILENANDFYMIQAVFGAYLLLTVLDDSLFPRIKKNLFMSFRFYLLFLVVWLLFPVMNLFAFGLLFSVSLLPVLYRKRNLSFLFIILLTIFICTVNPAFINKSQIYLHIGVVAILSVAFQLGIKLLLNDNHLKQLEHSRILYNGLMNIATSPILILDVKGKIVSWNKGFAELAEGLDEKEIRNRYPHDLFSSLEAGKMLYNGEENGIEQKSYELEIVKSNGQAVSLLVNEQKIYFDNIFSGFQLFGMDITKNKSLERELKEANERLKELIHIDPLTRIGNRRFFDKQLELEWKRAARNSNALSLLMIDVDFFKKYNDHYGHQKGDECLSLVAQSLDQSLMRASDFLARYGGEEFSVILPQTDKASAEKVADKLIKNLLDKKIEHALSSVSPYITISIGIGTLFPDKSGSQNVGELVAIADKALYRAKEQGRNRFSI